MKTILASISAVAMLAATGAYAADANILSADPVSSWGGAYVGAYGGFAAQRGTTTVSGVSGSSNFNGGRMGFFAGYNAELGSSIVAGIEGEIGYDFSKVTSSNSKFGTMWSARARLGYDAGMFLVYGAAGYAGTNVQVTNVGTTNKGTLHGWSVGTGVDAKLTDNIFARAEYRFNRLSGNLTVLGIPTSNTVNQHVFNIGIGYKF